MWGAHAHNPGPSSASVVPVAVVLSSGRVDSCSDGVFGRCQKVPAVDTYRYDASPLALQHLRLTLQKLSRTGFTWQDDHTQRVMAQELANLPRAHPQPLDPSSRARSPQQDVGDNWQYDLENEVALAKALQRYLPFLEALSQATASDVHPRLQHENSPSQGKDPFPKSVLTYVAHTAALTYPPTARDKYPENFPLRTLSRLQPDELSPKVDSTVDRQHLMAALGAYAARRPPLVPQEGDPDPQYLLQDPSRVPRPLWVAAPPQKWLSSPEDPRGPLSADDDVLLRSLLKDLWQRQAELEPVGPLELEEMVGTIAGPRPGDEALADKKDGRFHEVSLLSDHVQDHRSPLLPEAPTLEEHPKTEARKLEEPEVSLSWEEEDAGVENVKSLTYSKPLPEQPSSQPRAAGLGVLQAWVPGALQEEQSPRAGARAPPSQGLQLQVEPSEEEDSGYIVTGNDPLNLEKGKQLMGDVAHLLKVPPSIFEDIDVLGPAVTFKVSTNVQNVTTADVVKATADNQDQLEKASGLRILHSGVGPKSRLTLLPHQGQQEDSTKFILLTFLSVACIMGVLLASSLIYCLRHSSRGKLKEKLSGLGGDPGADATAAYQELCRQRMAPRPPDRPEGPHTSRINSVSSQFSDGPMPSPSARSSTSSWSEEPVQPDMDISTGHMILAYMEDHLKNKHRLEKEWDALCAYQAEPSSSLVAQREENLPKNRSLAVLTYDHSRILLKPENSHSNSDYINASPIMDHDPRNPAYIATQGPLPATVADFWQMVWESGCAVIVMLTPLTENGVRQSHHYWPDEGANLYHFYEVNLVSEHIWCEDFLVRSFYLKNLQTRQTRTVTQFHFLSWYDRGVPSSTGALLDFRRKVNKCYRGRSCPIIVHCSDGAGRSGTYVLIDMVLNKMAKGAKEAGLCWAAWWPSRPAAWTFSSQFTSWRASRAVGSAAGAGPTIVRRPGAPFAGSAVACNVKFHLKRGRSSQQCKPAMWNWPKRAGSQLALSLVARPLPDLLPFSGGGVCGVKSPDLGRPGLWRDQRAGGPSPAEVGLSQAPPREATGGFVLCGQGRLCLA
uniref:receptor-type tyrosine-protein phosphatase N2 isoform X5 n=1 Tax=Ictidomys tridecemlineatus TaxID=43179 RepID=UPI001A9D6026|nr:receptor-type tyrosine-protein phosphatase N2 isoform X5 [Ictidomys tridecemlineatus]